MHFHATTKPTRLAVIGGGIAGLTAAHALSRTGTSGDTPLEITVYEGGEKLGGLAAGFKGRDTWDWSLEYFYHHLFTNDDAIITLVRELGLSDLLEIHTPVTAMYYQGDLYPMDTPLRVLQFPHISIVDRIRMGMALAYLRYHPLRPWRDFDKKLADRWLAKWMGNSAYETLWQPMLQGKFGAHYADVNLAWFWARIYKRTRQLGYFKGGFQAFVDGLAEQVKRQNVSILTNAPVQQVHRTGTGHYRLNFADQPAQEFDAVISTVSPGLMTRMAPDLPGDYLGQLKSLKSMGAVVLTVALKRNLMENIYWANIPKREGLPFLALVEHTNMIDPIHYGGDHLIYIGDYLEPDHPHFSLNAEELLAEFLPHLSRFNPDFVAEWITGAWVHKAKYAQPVPGVGYADMIPSIRSPWQGFYFASMSQVYPWDRGTNYAVEIGQKTASLLAEDLQNGRIARPVTGIPQTV